MPGMNPQPLGHEPSALTTRPWLLAKAQCKSLFSKFFLLSNSDNDKSSLDSYCSIDSQ